MAGSNRTSDPEAKHIFHDAFVHGGATRGLSTLPGFARAAWCLLWAENCDIRGRARTIRRGQKVQRPWLRHRAFKPGSPTWSWPARWAGREKSLWRDNSPCCHPQFLGDPHGATSLGC